ncbi:hypothetical protein MKX03_031469 [Papaver bracteatum]|nr:hypothetical protein MKX03_031469 [Papaver bracteatum]
MGIVKFLVFFFVFLRFIPHLIEDSAFDRRCWCRKMSNTSWYFFLWYKQDEPTIQFSFTLKGRGREECGSPGYQLTCDGMNKTVLELPFSGKFFFFCIHVLYQKKKKKKKNCLSSSTHTVFATIVSIANIAPLNITCVHIADVQVPTLPIQDDDSFNLNEKFFLTLLGVFIGIPFIILLYFFPRTIFNIFANVFLVVFFFPHQPPIVRTGLSDSTIQSYPSVVLGESGRLPNPNDTSCTICIAYFQAKDTLKSMPTCNHCFHANCLEQWLRVNATCPVCRKSPLH